MGSFPGQQATSCPFFSFSSFLLLGIGDVVWLDQVQPETSWEVQGFPEFMICPEKAPVGKLHCSSSGYPVWGHCGCPLSPGLPWLPQCDASVFFLQENQSPWPPSSFPRYKGKTPSSGANLGLQIPPTCYVALGKLLRDSDPPFPFVYEMGGVK